MKLILALVLTLGTAFAAEMPSKPITLEAKPGNITFDHAKHKAAGVDCATCHEKNAVPQKIEKMEKEKAHAACHTCHKEKAKGPQKCADCHKKA